jgi:hypothetical protein
VIALRAPYSPPIARADPPAPGDESILVTGFLLFLAAAVVGGLIVWAWKGPAAGAATAWFISPIPPPPLSPI